MRFSPPRPDEKEGMEQGQHTATQVTPTPTAPQTTVATSPGGETTPTPTLANAGGMRYLCWTGADAANSVNVSALSI